MNAFTIIKMSTCKKFLRHGTSGLWTYVLLLVLAFCFLGVRATELTFELSDRAKTCFYEQIEKDTKCALEFQVSQCSIIHV